MASKTQSQRVYKLNTEKRVALYVLAGLIAAMGFGLSALYAAGILRGRGWRAEDALGLTRFAAGWLISFALFLVYLVSRLRLVTSPEGLEYRTLGYSVRTSWENVKQIGRVPVGRGVELDGLILREPVPRNHSRLGWLIAASPKDSIPIGDLNSRWRDGELGEDLRTYAPHLFADQAKTLSLYVRPIWSDFRNAPLYYRSVRRWAWSRWIRRK